MINFYDPLFKQTIYDHKKHLISVAKRVKISNMQRDIYKYRDTLFITTVLNLPKEMIWILKYLNDIDQSQTLVSKGILYVPDLNVIQSLYEKIIRLKAA
jgi:hypothetical protein